MLNALHPLRVWGDGRILWVENDSKGGRRVLEGHLTQPEMTDLLTKISDAGFFGWATSYQPKFQVYDAGTTTLSVNLTSHSQSVSEYAGEGAPQKYHELLAYLSGGAGASGADFAPTTGYLTAFAGQPASGQAPYHWPNVSLGYDLDKAASGMYIEGEALQFAWRAVNESYVAIVESGGMDYHIALQIPGVSQQEPPTK
jgi:hypothetical protein